MSYFQKPESTLTFLIENLFVSLLHCSLLLTQLLHAQLLHFFRGSKLNLIRVDPAFRVNFQKVWLRAFRQRLPHVTRLAIFAYQQLDRARAHAHGKAAIDMIVEVQLELVITPCATGRLENLTHKIT